jgi:hypothetical protein
MNILGLGVDHLWSPTSGSSRGLPSGFQSSDPPLGDLPLGGSQGDSPLGYERGLVFLGWWNETPLP